MTSNQLAADTARYYLPMLVALKKAGCAVYLTGSALVPGTTPSDLDYVVECPAHWTRADLDKIVGPMGFKDIDAKEGYEKDPSQTVPEDHNSDLGIYQAPGIHETLVLPATGPYAILPVQLLLFIRDSVAAGHWRKATAELKSHPDQYKEREDRVRLFRSIRGQAI